MNKSSRSLSGIMISAISSLLVFSACDSKSTSEPELPLENQIAFFESQTHHKSTEVEAKFTVHVDTKHATLATTRRHPQTEPAQTIRLSGENLDLSTRAKTMAARPGWIWLDLFFVNDSELGIGQLDISFSSEMALLDISTDPLSESFIDGSLMIGGIAAEGIAHLAIAVKEADSPVSFNVTVKGLTTDRVEAHSSPIVTSPDGMEVWASLADANTLVVVDTVTDRKIASISVPAKPSSVAITNDGVLVLVSSADANTLTVIDRKTRTIVQSFDEKAGIGRDPRHIVVSPDDSRVFVSSYVSDRITSLRRLADGTFRVENTLQLGRRPVGLAISSDSRTLYVAHFLPRGPANNNETWVSVVNTDPLDLVREIIWRDIGNKEEAKCLTKRFGVEPEKLSFEGTATQLAGVFLSPGGALGWIPGLRVGPTAIWEFAPGKVLPGVIRSTFSPSFLFFMDTRNAELARVKRHPLVIDIPDASLDFLRCADLEYDSESVVATPVPEQEGVIYSNGAAVPTGSTGLSEAGLSRFMTFSRGGRRALILSYTADELQVFDGITQQPVAKRQLKLSGSNPLGMVVTPDGSKGYVVYEGSTFLSVLDLTAYAQPKILPEASYVPYEYQRTDRANNSFLTEARLVRFIDDVPAVPPITEIGQIEVITNDPMDPKVRRGRILFSSSNPEKHPELTASRQAACVSCHPGGGHDGTVWGTMEGERRTVSLYGGVAGRGWLHQSATHPDILDFVEIVVPERLGGSGLSNADYEALAGYSAFHIPKIQSPATDPEQVERGEFIFLRACAACHNSPTYSGGNPNPDHPWGGASSNSRPLLFDIGTATESANVLLPSFFSSRLPPPANRLYDIVRGDRELGDNDPAQEILEFRPRANRAKGAIRPPSLINVWDYSVFFHDGRFTNLEDVMDYLNKQLKLGLSPEELSDVTAYVKTL